MQTENELRAELQNINYVPFDELRMCKFVACCEDTVLTKYLENDTCHQINDLSIGCELVVKNNKEFKFVSQDFAITSMYVVVFFDVDAAESILDILDIKYAFNGRSKDVDVVLDFDRICATAFLHGKSIEVTQTYVKIPVIVFGTKLSQYLIVLELVVNAGVSKKIGHYVCLLEIDGYKIEHQFINKRKSINVANPTSISAYGNEYECNFCCVDFDMVSLSPVMLIFFPCLSFSSDINKYDVEIHFNHVVVDSISYHTDDIIHVPPRGKFQNNMYILPLANIQDSINSLETIHDDFLNVMSSRDFPPTKVRRIKATISLSITTLFPLSNVQWVFARVLPVFLRNV